LSAIEDVKSAVQGVVGKVGGLGELPPAKLLGGARLAIGATGVLTPGISAWVTGLKPGRNPPASYLVRLNGASNAALGAAMLSGPEASRPLLVQLGLATDVLGLLANVIMLSAVLVGFMFVIGLSFGGFRLLYYRIYPEKAAAHEEAQRMIRLNL